MTRDEMIAHAATIRSLGGRTIGARLRRLAANVQPGQAIVELGVWFGSGTAQLAIGSLDSGATVHAIDHFRATHMPKFGGEYAPGQDLLPVVRESLAPIGVKVELHQGYIQNMRPEWAQETVGTVGLYVDDACKTEERWSQAMKCFRPLFVAGVTTLVLMDYFWYLKTKKEKHKAQLHYMGKNRTAFKLIERCPELQTAAVFRYEGE